MLSEPLEKRLTLSIAFPNTRDPERRGELVFAGVLGHFMEGELHQNVILEVCELPVADLVRSYAFLFQRERPFIWPCSSSNDADLVSRLIEQGARAFEICSAIGLRGFVLARSVDVRVARPRA